MIQFFRSILVLTLLASVGVARAADMTPDELVKSTTEDVVSVVKQDKDIQAGNRAKIFALVEEKVLPHFDFKRMTQLAMGKNWRQAKPEQQEGLIKEFRTLLVRTYAVSISQYRDQKIEYKPFKMDANGKDATVKSLFVQSGRDPVSVDYSMRKGEAGWKVYNITVEGVSLIENYRNTFNEQIRKEGIDGLIKTLAERNKAADSKG